VVTAEQHLNRIWEKILLEMMAPQLFLLMQFWLELERIELRLKEINQKSNTSKESV